ncbi:hypothetical protein SLL00_17120 [Metabacillus indicus]|uniref:hypothetical protein n=1 Tax=Metabacillus indicus TaxID=246786 RepID=UPI002A047060|nr:hypothetical protein [Metabacillus indicus]MDX8291536.1 hypothetical protein [Metabacillus indicus]
MTLIVALILILLLVTGIRKWKKNKLAAILLFSPIVICILFFSFFLFHSIDRVKPDSLIFETSIENGRVHVSGSWSERLDYYHFLTDYLIFYIPENKSAGTVSRSRTDMHTKMDWKYLMEDVEHAIKREGLSELEPQIYDVKTEKDFHFSFTLPDGVKAEELEIYYAHVREEPMESLEYWFKRVPITGGK